MAKKITVIKKKTPKKVTVTRKPKRVTVKKKY